MKTGKKTLLIGLMAALALCASAEARKFIASGWEFQYVDVDGLLARADEMDKAPIDGCMLYVQTEGRDGKRIASREIMQSPKWDWADLEPLVPKYRQLTAHKAFRHSFLDCFRAAKKRILWTDDAAWSRVAHNVRLIAKLAKAGGFTGLVMDTEDYHKQRQYYRLDSDGLPYEELVALARKRGREIFSGVFKEFPDAKILSYWFLSWDGYANAEMPMEQARDIMNSRGNCLMQHFIDGIFDVLPPSATLIEGMEFAYSWRASKMQYYTTANHIRNSVAGLLSPENRAKYRSQMQTSFGVYLDGYSVKTNGMYYMEPVDGSRLRHLRNNHKQASDAADEFLWLWCEKGAWIERGLLEPAWKTWREYMPGLYATMLAVKDPAAMGLALRKRMEAGKLANVNANSACSAFVPGLVPKPYSTWQESAKKKFRQGKFGVDTTCGHGDTSSLVAEGVETGSFVLDVERHRPGDVVGVSFCSKGRHTSASVGWKRNGKWDWDIPRVLIPLSKTADADGWTQTDWCVIVPEGADGFGLTLGVCQDAGEKTWFDDIYVIPAKDLNEKQ